MAELSVNIPPAASHPDFEALKRRAVMEMESNLAFRAKCQTIMRTIPNWGYMRAVTGAGLVMGNTLRDGIQGAGVLESAGDGHFRLMNSLLRGQAHSLRRCGTAESASVLEAGALSTAATERSPRRALVAPGNLG